MGIWNSIFGWKALFRWDVMGAVVPGVFLAGGLAMLGVDWFPHHLLISQICFGIATFLCVVKIVGHALESDGSRMPRIFFGGSLGLLTLFLGVGTILIIQKHKTSSVQVQVPALDPPPSAPGPTHPAPKAIPHRPRKQMIPAPDNGQGTKSTAPSTRPEQATTNIAPGGFAISGGYVDHPEINNNNYRNPLPEIAWAQNGSENADKNTAAVTVELKDTFYNPAFLARCSVPCYPTSEGTLTGRFLVSNSKDADLIETDNPAIVGFSYHVSQLSPGTRLVLSFRSRDGSPLSIMEVKPFSPSH